MYPAIDYGSIFHFFQKFFLKDSKNIRAAGWKAVLESVSYSLQIKCKIHGIPPVLPHLSKIFHFSAEQPKNQLKIPPQFLWRKCEIIEPFDLNGGYSASKEATGPRIFAQGKGVSHERI